MTECKKIRELLDQYIDGELDESEAELLRAHLEKCEACRQEERERRELSEFLRETAENAPPELLDRVMSEVKGIGKKKGFKIAKYASVAAAAVVALAFFATPISFFISGGAGAKMEAEDADAMVADRAEIVVENASLSDANGKNDYYYSGEKFPAETYPVLDDAVNEEIEQPTADVALYEYIFLFSNGDKLIGYITDDRACVGENEYDYSYDGELVLKNQEEVLVFKWNADRSRFEQVE